jgi:hypothetical protein
MVSVAVVGVTLADIDTVTASPPMMSEVAERSRSNADGFGYTAITVVSSG